MLFTFPFTYLDAILLDKPYISQMRYPTHQTCFRVTQCYPYITYSITLGVHATTIERAIRFIICAIALHGSTTRNISAIEFYIGAIT